MKSIYIITVLLIFSNLNTVAAQLYGSGKIETKSFENIVKDLIKSVKVEMRLINFELINGGSQSPAKICI